MHSFAPVFTCNFNPDPFSSVLLYHLKSCTARNPRQHLCSKNKILIQYQTNLVLSKSVPASVCVSVFNWFLETHSILQLSVHAVHCIFKLWINKLLPEVVFQRWYQQHHLKSMTDRSKSSFGSRYNAEGEVTGHGVYFLHSVDAEKAKLHCRWHVAWCIAVLREEQTHTFFGQLTSCRGPVAGAAMQTAISWVFPPPKSPLAHRSLTESPKSVIKPLRTSLPAFLRHFPSIIFLVPCPLKIQTKACYLVTLQIMPAPTWSRGRGRAGQRSRALYYCFHGNTYRVVWIGYAKSKPGFCLACSISSSLAYDNDYCMLTDFTFLFHCTCSHCPLLCKPCFVANHLRSCWSCRCYHRLDPLWDRVWTRMAKIFLHRCWAARKICSRSRQWNRNERWAGKVMIFTPSWDIAPPIIMLCVCVSYENSDFRWKYLLYSLSVIGECKHLMWIKKSWNPITLQITTLKSLVWSRVHNYCSLCTLGMIMIVCLSITSTFLEHIARIKSKDILNHLVSW